MRSYVTLYVPSNYTSVKVEASQAMARIAGGVTITEAWGIWEDTPEFPLVHDKLWLLKSFASDIELKALTLTVRYYANKLVDAGEQSVAIEINGELNFEPHEN